MVEFLYLYLKKKKKKKKRSSLVITCAEYIARIWHRYHAKNLFTQIKWQN